MYVPKPERIKILYHTLLSIMCNKFSLYLVHCHTKSTHLLSRTAQAYVNMFDSPVCSDYQSVAMKASSVASSCQCL